MPVSLLEALRCVVVTLEQHKTFPADIAYALAVAKDALAAHEQANPKPVRCARCGESPHLFTDEKCEAQS